MKIRIFLGAVAASLALLQAGPGRRATAQPAPETPRVIGITAKRFAFLPAEIRLKKGEPVVLRLTTEDVRHGLFSRPLGINAEFAPGQARDIALTPSTTGTFTVICDRFCGSGHGNMKISVVVE
ncbi:MAG TPA: cupredoxin domain-containing protein [Thermoanaerobaculia bacterium]|jgi:cytochrome c oxidase subunit 2|nr:cupredoxin domain-containing protein [Thermoanaerobaculia bacterium]